MVWHVIFETSAVLEYSLQVIHDHIDETFDHIEKLVEIENLCTNNSDFILVSTNTIKNEITNFGRLNQLISSKLEGIGYYGYDLKFEITNKATNKIEAFFERLEQKNLIYNFDTTDSQIRELKRKYNDWISSPNRRRINLEYNRLKGDHPIPEDNDLRILNEAINLKRMEQSSIIILSLDAHFTFFPKELGEEFGLNTRDPRNINDNIDDNFFDNLKYK